MTTRIWSKPVTQAFIKRLRDAGYTVDKLDSGYVCHHTLEAKSGFPSRTDQVFKAMIGSRGYLVMINTDYICDIEMVPAPLK